MKPILFSFLLLLTIISCKHNSASQDGNIDDELNELVQSSEYEEHGLAKRRGDIDTVDIGGARKVIIKSMPDESLPHVQNISFGKKYCDNRIMVRVVGDTSVIVAHDFIKADFIAFLDATLRQNAILDEMSVVSEGDNCVMLEACLSVPHSDEQAIVNVALGFGGDVSFSKPNAQGNGLDDEDVED